VPDVTYTHGHHASVLRSHTWRTAENSAAHLLPHLRAGLDAFAAAFHRWAAAPDGWFVVLHGEVLARP